MRQPDVGDTCNAQVEELEVVQALQMHQPSIRDLILGEAERGEVSQTFR